MAAFSGKRGHFDLVIEIYKNNQMGLVKWFYSQQNKSELFMNSDVLKQIKDALVAYGNDEEISEFVADCFIHKVPVEIYESFMIKDVNFVIKMAPYLRIICGSECYDSLNDLIQKYLWTRKDLDTEVLYLSRIINILRFGDDFDSQVYETEIEWRNYDANILRFLGKIASNSGKIDVLTKIYENPKSNFEAHCKNLLVDVVVSDGFEVKPCFDILGIKKVEEMNEILKNEKYLKLAATNFYAIEGIKIEHGILLVYLKATEAMRSAGWVESLRFELKGKLAELLEELWVVMKADHLKSFLIDYGKLPLEPRNQSEIITTFKVIKSIAESETLRLLAEKARLKFRVSAFDLLKVNISVRNDLFVIVDLYAGLHYAKGDNDLLVIEEYSGKTVAEIILEKEGQLIEYGGVSEASYFAIRTAFSYWINGPERIRIKDLRTLKVIELLNLEFKLNQLIKK